MDLFDGNGMGVLAVSAHTGDVRLCKMLVENGAPLGSRDVLGLTPLHHAAFKGHVAVVRLLSKTLTLHTHGSTVDFTFDDSDEALTDAATHGSTLFDAGLSARAKTEIGPTPSRRADFRRNSLLGSVRFLLKRSTGHGTGVNAAPSAQSAARLAGSDVSFFTALDPLSLAGLVEELIGAGFDSSSVTGVAGRSDGAAPRQTRVSASSQVAGGVALRQDDVDPDLLHVRRTSDVGVELSAGPGARRSSGAARAGLGGKSAAHGGREHALGVRHVGGLKGASSPPAASTVMSDAVDHSGRGWAASATYVALPRMPLKTQDVPHPSAALLRAAGKFIPRVSPLTLAVQVCQSSAPCLGD